jgi:hypothetical protein
MILFDQGLPRHRFVLSRSAPKKQIWALFAAAFIYFVLLFAQSECRREKLLLFGHTWRISSLVTISGYCHESDIESDMDVVVT